MVLVLEILYEDAKRFFFFKGGLIKKNLGNPAQII